MALSVQKNIMLTFKLTLRHALHNICIDRPYPCQSRWRLEVEQLELMEKPLSRAVDKEESNLVRIKISNWL